MLDQLYYSGYQIYKPGISKEASCEKSPSYFEISRFRSATKWYVLTPKLSAYKMNPNVLWGVVRRK